MKFFLSLLACLFLTNPVFAQGSGFANGAGFDNGVKTGSGGGGSGTINSGTTNQVAVYSGSTTVSSGIITDNGINVGIGSSSPSQKLDVNGTVRISGGNSQITATSGFGIDGSNTGVTTFNVNNSRVGIGTALPNSSLEVVNTSSDAPLQISSAGGTTGDLFQIDHGGNIGIGTSILQTGNLPLVQVWSNHNVVFGPTQNSNGNVWLINRNVTNSDFNAIKFLSSNATSGSATQLAYIAGVYTNHTSGSMAGELSFGTAQNSAQAEAIRINSAQNVGIGTSVPITRFDVNRKFNVTSTGNVGIGSINPAQALDVQGTVIIRGGSGAASTATCWCADGITLGHASGLTVLSGAATCNNAVGVC